MALDIAGYHSPTPDKATFVEPGSQTQGTSASTSTDKRIPFPPSKPSTPSHLQTSFPARRAVSESPEDVTSKHDTLTVDAVNTSLSVQQYSWEWGGFPQPSPLQTHFTSSALKGKADDACSAVDDDELILKRSRSVPPELEGSPHTVMSPLPLVDGDGSEPSLRPPDHPQPGEGKDGRITARHDDQTKFQVWIDGTSVDFELSLVASRDAIHNGDEAESARTFDEGVIDYARLMADENLVRNELLVMRWTGKEYITREEQSPLMDALQAWVSTARGERLTGLPPPSSPTLPPSRTEQEPVSTADEREGLKRADSEPLGVPSRKSTSSSWVRWWRRSRDIPDLESPILRETATLPLDQVDIHPYRYASMYSRRL